LNSAVEDGLLARNPCIIWGAGVERSPERPVATIEQLYELANAMGPRYRLMVLLATFCGLRLGELLALRRARVDPLHRQIKVNEQRQELADGSRFLWAAQERSRHSIDRLATAPARGG
jgi:integrase